MNYCFIRLLIQKREYLLNKTESICFLDFEVVLFVKNQKLMRKKTLFLELLYFFE